MRRGSQNRERESREAGEKQMPHEIVDSRESSLRDFFSRCELFVDGSSCNAVQKSHFIIHQLSAAHQCVSLAHIFSIQALAVSSLHISFIRERRQNLCKI